MCTTPNAAHYLDSRITVLVPVDELHNTTCLLLVEIIFTTWNLAVTVAMSDVIMSLTMSLFFVFTSVLCPSPPIYYFHFHPFSLTSPSPPPLPLIHPLPHPPSPCVPHCLFPGGQGTSRSSRDPSEPQRPHCDPRHPPAAEKPGGPGESPVRTHCCSVNNMQIMRL